MNWLTTQWIEEYSVYVATLTIILIAALYSVFALPPDTPELNKLVGTKSVLEGVVIRDPDIREKVIMLTVRTSVGTVLVSTDRFGSYEYGDKVRVEGKVELPKEFVTDTARTFNYPMYLRAHGITHTVSFADVVVIARGEGNQLIRSLTSLKHWFVSGIEKALPEPHASLLAGLLVGEKRGLGESLTESFRRAGVIHIIVLSGYNVALVINYVFLCLAFFLSRRFALLSSGIVAILFMIMVGASETAIRATLMALVVLLARALYRPADGLRILFVVAAGMAIWNPYLVLFDLSYQLSILATFGLIVFSERLVPYLTWLRSKSLIETVSTTLATQIAVLPLLVYSVGQVSLVSLITNILILAVVPWAMFTGFVAALVAHVSVSLAFPFSAITYALLHYIIVVAEFLGSLPYAAINL